VFRAGVIFIFTFLVIEASQGQQLEVRGRFFADSLKIGEPVPFGLVARYPKELNLVFPDSSFAFAPFEFSKKQFFPTVTKGNISYDSVVYFLTSYEIDSAQFTKLPVFVIHPDDCTAVYSEQDTVFLKHLVAAVPDSVAAPQLPLKTQTSYLNVKWLLNYPLLLIIGGALILVLILVWVFFGKRIRKYFQIKKLHRHHQQFIDRFTSAVDQLTSSYTTFKAEQALVIWKQYMENLETKPFTKYTSKEIIQTEKDEHLAGALKLIDRMIYGGRISETHSFVELRNYTQTKFKQKVEAVRHE
jgi:hypothetical protein